ncbi:MAG: 23S rRNA pseudouridine(2604) synthase RluF [Roseburia sp.]
MDDAGIRINKYLSEAGVCSRREADRMVEQGRITIDGRIARMGDRILPGNQVCLDHKPVTKQECPILIAFNKPAGIVCTTAKQEKNNVVDFIGYPIRIYPIGRLDKDSQGLLLLTNQGDLVNKIMRAGNYHEKEYEVTVDRPITESFLKGMGRGVPLEELGVVTRPCVVKKQSDRKFGIVLTQGYNRQIRRMCEYFGYHVVTLKRIRIMNIRLDGIKEGTYRPVTEKEMQQLRRMLEDSTSETVKGRKKRNGRCSTETD